MKRAKNLYQLIPTHENLREAFRKAAKGKQTDSEVIRFRSDFNANIQKLREQLLKHEPDIGCYRFFTIRDPKVRTVCAASFPERVLHHAIMNICEPVLNSYAIDDSYACRKGKGNQKALARAQQFTRQNSWYLKLDIRKYFDSIDHAIALRLLSRRFKDTDLLTLFQQLLNAYHTQPGKGVPIGNLFSQHLANFYLDHFDRWIKESRHIKAYVRYMDDFILFSEDKFRLKTELEAIKIFLKNHLELTLKENIQINRTCRGVPFLGFRVFPYHVRLLPLSMRRFSAKYREYERNYSEGLWSESEMIRHMEPLVAFTNLGDSVPFRRMAIEKFGVLF
ncbi:MAG: group II intron reverse transcriptase domain-containing protein [SAR324 cluster bacterium]|nr:group II intron reverse transcriptase domain-containing protein [SAR324 cluster bacterium]